MAKSIQELKSRIQQDGLMRDNLFEIRLIAPKWAKDTRGDIPEMLEIYCRDFDIPGVSVSPEEYRPTGFGLLERRPTAAIISDMQAIFMIDAKTEILKFFQDWINNIVVFDTESAPSGQFYGAVRYKKEYITTMEVDIPNYGGGNAMTWTGIDCWPSALNNVSMSWDANNEIAKAVVVFQLRTWKTRTANVVNSGRAAALVDIPTGITQYQEEGNPFVGLPGSLEGPAV